MRMSILPLPVPDGTAAKLNIMGMPEFDNIGPAKGYLFYQMIGLNKDGTPYADEASPERPNTWMPLTVDSTMLTSGIWEAVKAAIAEGRMDAPSSTDPTLQAVIDTALGLPLETVLGLLTADLLGQFANPFLKGLEPVIGFGELNNEQYQLLVDVLHLTVDIIDHLVPVTFESGASMVMPIQDEKLPLMVGDYGIRAMGIDTLFNVGAYVEPTRLRIVNPKDSTNLNRASVVYASIGDPNGDGHNPLYEGNIIYANTTDGVELTIQIDQHPHFLAGISVEYQDENGDWQQIGTLSEDELAGTQAGATFTVTWADASDAFSALVGTGNVMVRAVATNLLQLTDAEPTEHTIRLDPGIYPPEVLALVVDEDSITQTNPDSGGPQGMVTVKAYTRALTGPETVKVRFELTQSDGTTVTLDPDTAMTGSPATDIPDVVQAALASAIGGADASLNPDEYHEWTLTIDTAELPDTITKDSGDAARDASMDSNQHTIRAFAVSGDDTAWPSDAMTTLSVDNVDDVEPLGPTDITAVANADGMVAADPDGGYTLLGLVDAYDTSVIPQILKLTIQPGAERKTYESVRLVSNPVIDAGVIETPVEISEGVFEITVNIGELGIAGNRSYTLHAVAYDEFNNVQVHTDETTERTIHVKNYLRPNPTVVQLTVDDGTGMNVDSGGPQGTLTFSGYTLEQTSPPIMSIRLEAKRESDPDTAWQDIGTGSVSTSVDIEDGSLPDVLYHLAEAVVEGTEGGDRSVVEIDATYREWLVSVDTIALGLADTITKDSGDAARAALLDDDQYMVRAYAVDTNGNEVLSDATTRFSLDNIDDVGPLASTEVRVTNVSGRDAFYREDGNRFTVSGLVDEYDNAVPSPVATFTITPAAARDTYATVNFTMDTASINAVETAEGSGVFTATVDIGVLANKAYTFQALAVDEFGNSEDDTDESKASVTVANTRRPPPAVLSISVDPASITQRNVDSGGPQGTIKLNARTPVITSPPISGMYFEVRRPSDTTWTTVGTSAIKGTWMREVDTTVLEDTITKDNPNNLDALYDHTQDNNQYMVRATAIAVNGSRTVSPVHVTARFSVDNVDDVGPRGRTRVSVEPAEDGSYTVGGLVDKYDLENVPAPMATFTIQTDADPNTYESVRFFTDIENLVFGDVMPTGEQGVFTVDVNVGILANGEYLENNTYMFYALAFDELGNEQDDDGTRTPVTVANTYRPEPEVLALAVDPDSVTQTNPDSGAPQGTIRLHAYSHEISSPPTTAVRFEVKRPDDAEWMDIGTANNGMATTEISDAALSDIVGYLANTTVSIAEETGEAAVDISGTYQMWEIEVDTLGLEDTITKDSGDATRDHTQDKNQYEVRAVPIEGAGDFEDPEASPNATTRFSVDNVDDIGPLGPTNVSVEPAEDGSLTVGGLVDKYDLENVPSPMATFIITAQADPNTYESVRFFTDIENLVFGDVMPTEEQGVFTVNVDVGILADRETYLENGTYMFYALAFDELGNEQDDDGTRTPVTVANTYRPEPEVLALVVDKDSITQTNPDSGAPQGTIKLHAYSHEISSPPTNAVRFEVKRPDDAEWMDVGTANNSMATTEISDAALSDIVGYLANEAVSTAEAEEGPGEAAVDISGTYQMWEIEVDTIALELEDTITKDSGDATRDHTQDKNQYEVRAVPIEDADDFEDPEASPNATAMFSVDNVDDVAPLAPTNVSATSVDGVDTVFETAEDGSFTVGGLVDKYDETVASPVATFTIEPVAARNTYESVRLAMFPEGALVGEITETAEGSGIFTVTVDVGTLADGETYLENGTYVFQALAKDEFGNEETDGSKTSVTVENTYRPAPEVLVIAVDPESIAQTNPDSGAPQGTIALNARSHAITSPPISGMRYEVKRPGDEAWIDVGTATATERMLVSGVSDAELTDFVGDVARAAANATEANESGEATVVPINRSQTYQEWTLPVDTTTLEDTITADSPAARDASKDTNQYMVRVTAIAEADGSETMSADGITAHFSVDNVDDVEPLGPTNIVAVADVAGMIAANEDGSYTVGGIVDDTVPSPIAIFTTQPTADPMTYASVNLVQTTGDTAETVAEGEAGVLDLTIDVGMLENGTYMFHALAVDEFGNVQTDESPMVTVHVLNFRVADVTDITVIAVDGTDVAEAPAAPIPLRNAVTVSFMVANGSLALEELTGAVNGQPMTGEPMPAEDPENTFTLTVALGSLSDGIYTPDAVVTKRNGSVAFPVTEVNVDNTGPVITIESPTEDETVDSLPTIRATYHDGAGSGVNGGTESLTLVRLQPPNEVEVDVDQADLEKDTTNLVYTRSEPLAGGAYRVTVQVTDNLGNVGTGSGEFAVNGTLPTVAMQSPASGQTFEHGTPLISGEFSGAGTVEVTTFTINDVDATPEVDGNRFSYTPEEALTNGDYKVVVAVTDGDGNMAQTSVTFMVDIPEPPKDTTPPIISTAAPSGLIKIGTHGAVITLSAVVSDEQSDLTAVKFRVADVNGSINTATFRSVSLAHIKAGEIATTYLLEPGSYNAEVVATSQGGTTKYSWSFTLVFDNVKPTISSITPSGTVRGGLPVISASASDESGIDKMTIAVMDSGGEEVKGSTADDAEEGVEGITRLDFNPEEPLDEGVYTIEVRATDTLGNSTTAKGTFTVDFDTAAPIITMSSPQNNTRLMYAEGEARRPTISISYADAETGIDVDSIRFVFNDKLINLTPKQKSASQVTYIHPEELAPGQYSVKLEVSDRAHQEGNVSDKNKGAREANMAVYEFTFSVEVADGPILAARPLNYPNPFKDNTRISFTLARQATVSIVIYDATLRPVRVLVDNVVLDAGEYTRKDVGSDAIGWDGKSSSGEDLARGIYFCEIIVADGFEPEYAILKLALTR